MSDETHECAECGMMCDCDGEDMHNPQPSSCVHLAGPECCEMDEPDDDRAAVRDPLAPASDLR